jgi:hypothetical protein
MSKKNTIDLLNILISNIDNTNHVKVNNNIIKNDIDDNNSNFKKTDIKSIPKLNIHEIQNITKYTNTIFKNISVFPTNITDDLKLIYQLFLNKLIQFYSNKNKILLSINSQLIQINDFKENIENDLQILNTFHTNIITDLNTNKNIFGEYGDTIFFQKTIINIEYQNLIHIKKLYSNKYYGDLYKLHLKLDNNVIKYQDLKFYNILPKTITNYNDLNNHIIYTESDTMTLINSLEINILKIAQYIHSFLLKIGTITKKINNGFDVENLLFKYNYDIKNVIIETHCIIEIFIHILDFIHDFYKIHITKLELLSKEIQVSS